MIHHSGNTATQSIVLFVIGIVEMGKSVDFPSVILTNKCHATQDGPDKWAKCWISSHHCSLVRVRHQQGRGGVMFCPTIIDDK